MIPGDIYTNGKNEEFMEYLFATIILILAAYFLIGGWFKWTFSLDD